MARITDPTTFSDYYGVDPSQLDRLGVLNPTLAIDTKLFIDPLLLGDSAHREIAKSGREKYRRHFESIIALLARSAQTGDVAWRNAARLFRFHEIRATCLGYGAASIQGSAFGSRLTQHVMETAKQIVDLGVRDPDLFVALALFEEGIGPDRLSDMTTNVILDALVDFNARILDELGVPGEPFVLEGRNVRLAANPLETRRTPVLLVPADILRELPLATDWDGVASAAARNAQLRHRVNAEIAHLWAAKSRRDKEILKDESLADSEAFETLLAVLHSAPAEPYDVRKDVSGLRRWAEDGARAARENPLDLLNFDSTSIDGVHRIVQEIVRQFVQLVERRDLWKSLWSDSKPLPEAYAQRLFFTVAYGYCKANNLDISPEADTGRGAVDFKLSSGFDSRVLVEVKLSTNSRVVAGYTRQLEIYKVAEETLRAVYLVIDVGRMGRKDRQLHAIRNEAASNGNPVSDLVIVDGTRKRSASKT